MTTEAAQRTAVTKHVAAEGTSYQQMERMASAIAKSGMFGVKTPEQAIALMMIAQAEGRHPATAAQDYHVIQNRPALKADTMLARFQAAGGKVEWKEYSDAKVVGVFSHAQGGSVTIDWDIPRAQRAGLAGKDNWKNYPRAQMRARCISEGVRTVFPGVATGIYTVEEAQDMVDVTPEKSPMQTELDAMHKDIQAESGHGLTDADLADHFKAIDAATDQRGLMAAFNAGWVHAKNANDDTAKARLKAAYDDRKAGVAP
jgi:hypothetical protein